MEHAIIVAKIFGPVLTLLGFWMLFCPDDVRQVSEDFQKTPSMLYMSAVMNLIFGFAVLGAHHHWDWHLSVLVTIFGWLMIIRGFFGLFFSREVTARWMAACLPIARGLCIIPLILGLGMLWMLWCHCACMPCVQCVAR